LFFEKWIVDPLISGINYKNTNDAVTKF